MEFKGTKGKWKNEGSNVYVEGKLMFTCWSENTEQLDYRQEGESWLDMRNRTKDERVLLTQTIPNANSLLISKAPEMLESIKELLALLEFHGHMHSTEIYKANELIKEATTI